MLNSSRLIVNRTQALSTVSAAASAVVISSFSDSRSTSIHLNQTIFMHHSQIFESYVFVFDFSLTHLFGFLFFLHRLKRKVEKILIIRVKSIKNKEKGAQVPTRLWFTLK